MNNHAGGNVMFAIGVFRCSEEGCNQTFEIRVSDYAHADRGILTKEALNRLEGWGQHNCNKRICPIHTIGAKEQI